MAYSKRETVSHVIRRLGIGARADVVDGIESTDAAIARSLDLSADAATPPAVEPPEDYAAATKDRGLEESLGFWVEQMISSPRLIEERMVWFWHDHFATSLRKVQAGFLMWQQHLTLRANAVGSFARLLHDVARDPAMLIYLDGVSNQRGAVNENFGREVMELFTIGRGKFTETDVIAAARSCSGWVVNIPGRRNGTDLIPAWDSVLVPFRHDGGIKTFLGVSGRHTIEDVIDILLDHPATADRIAAKLYTELTGLRADEALTSRLGAAFRRDYQVRDLVEAIVADPSFVSEDAIRSRVRSPIEKAVGIAQSLPTHPQTPGALARGLHSIGYLPFFPPNVAGYPKGPRLLGPHQMVHTFDLAAMADPRRLDMTTTEIFARLGIHDVSATSRQVVDAAAGSRAKLALAVNSPEYTLT